MESHHTLRAPFLSWILGVFVLLTEVPGLAQSDDRSLRPLRTYSSETEWEQLFQTPYWDYGTSCAPTSDGCYVLVGYTRSFDQGEVNDGIQLIKTHRDGSLDWMRAFTGDKNDYGHCVTQTSDGKYVVFGFTGSFDAQCYDFWLLKTEGGIGNASDIAQPAQQPGLEDPQDGDRDWETEFYRVAKEFWPGDVLGLYPHRFAGVVVDDPGNA